MTSWKRQSTMFFAVVAVSVMVMQAIPSSASWSAKWASTEKQTTGGPGTWCIARADASNSDLQDALDWACGQQTGQGNVDCSAINNGGSCDQPDTLLSHASYAFNAYFQRMNQAQGSCDFNNCAQITTTDPSSGACTFPSSASSAGFLTTTNVSSSDLTNGSNGIHYNSLVTVVCLFCSWMLFSVAIFGGL